MQMSSQRLYPHKPIIKRTIFSFILFTSQQVSSSSIYITKMDLIVYTEPTIPTKITHVTKTSSDELLRKFADSDDFEEAKPTKRRKKSAKSSGENGVDIESNTIALIERKRLLLAPATKRRYLFLRQLASGKSHLRNKSLVKTIGKTWRKTMEGASRVFIEKHYNRHRRLINDVV